MLSRFFIERPVFAVVISAFIVIAGLTSMRVLPVSQYPEIAPPVVLVRAVYPGASAEVLEDTVAAPLEAQINGVDNMLYMESTSTSNGVVEINVTFAIGADADQAEIAVNNRVKQAEARLPEPVRRQGVVVEKSSSSFLQVLAFRSPDGRYDDIYTSNYVTMNVLDRLKRVPGTTGVQIFGAKDYAMRIWLRPDRLARLNLTTGEVAAAIREQNAQFAPGKIGQPPNNNGQQLVYTITSKGRLETVEEFEQVVLRTHEDGSIVYLKDVADVELGSRDYEFIGRVNGQAATLVGIFLQPGTNALEVADSVDAVMRELAAEFPQGLEYNVVYDTTRFVKVSIREVLKTLVEAMILVFLVVFLFLQNWRATLIPTLAVPVSLIGAFAGLHLLGYSINTLTLFGMVLAIGIVVDDAIIVLENVERIMHEQHKPPREAAVQAMREVTGPVIAIVLVLIAAFVPIAFVGGLAGELYRQFAVAVSISVGISGVVALTLTPALCALILQPGGRARARFFVWFNGFFSRLTARYTAGVAWMLRRAGLGLALFAGMVAITAGLWKFTPGSLVPEEDQGYYITAVMLPDGATLQRTDAVVQEVVEQILSNPANENAVAFTGFDFLGGGFRNSAATVFVTQKHWDEREVTAPELVGELFAKTGHIREGLVLAFNPPAIFGLGTAGGFELYIQSRDDAGPARLNEVAQEFIAAANADPLLANVATQWRANVPQLHVDIDRAKAKILDVPVDEVFNTLSSTLGTAYLNDFNRHGRTWQVLMSAHPDFRGAPGDVGGIYVRSADGRAVPLSALAAVDYTSGPETMHRFNNMPAVKVFGGGRPGVSTGQAIERVERLLENTLPAGFSYGWAGASFQEKASGGAGGFALLLAAIMVFLILAAQYERWSLPFSVLLAMPFGTFGALLAVWITGLTNDVYFQIGLVTLLALAAKNAILIVEFAIYKLREGLNTKDAVLAAARLRFRPILMTSLAFILGVTPLAFSSGAGAGARQSVGTGVMGGMLAATFLAIFFVPLFFRLINDLRLRRRKSEAGAERSGGELAYE